MLDQVDHFGLLEIKRGGVDVFNAKLTKNVYESKLKSRAVLVINYLIFRSNKENTCFPSIKTIARDVHVSVNTVKRALDDLVDAGFVKKEARFIQEKNGAQTSNLYTLCEETFISAGETQKESEDFTESNEFDGAIESKKEVPGQERVKSDDHFRCKEVKEENKIIQVLETGQKRKWAALQPILIPP
jgi:DNA-binding transcriptional regulator YhcF (GntR family)